MILQNYRVQVNATVSAGPSDWSDDTTSSLCNGEQRASDRDAMLNRKARNTFDGLTPGQNHRVRVHAVGSAGPGDWSDDADLIVV